MKSKTVDDLAGAIGGRLFSGSTWKELVRLARVGEAAEAGVRPARVHILKTVEPYFSDVASGKKTFELREYADQGPGKPARDFQPGDTARFVPVDGEGTVLDRKIVYVLRDTDPCMKGRLTAGYCILGLAAEA